MFETEDAPLLTEADASLPTTRKEAEERHARIVNHARRLQEEVKAYKADVEGYKKTEAQQDLAIEKMGADLRLLTQRIAEIDAARAAKPVDEPDHVLRRFIDPVTKRLSLTQLLGPKLPATERSGESRQVVGGGLLTSKPLTETQSQLQKACERLYVGVVMVYGRKAFVRDGVYDERIIRDAGPLWDDVQFWWKRMPEEVRRAYHGKAWDGASGTGAEFIPTPTLSSPFWQVQEHDPDNWMQVIPTIDLPSLDAKIPAGTQLPRPYVLKGSSGDDPAALAKSSVGTGEIDPGIVAMYALSLVFKDKEIGAVIPVIPFVMESLAKSVAIGMRFCQVNGHAAGSQDALATWDLRGMFGALDAGPIDYLRAHDGIRRIGFAGSNTVNRGTFDLDALLEDMTKPTGPKGAISDNVVATSPEGYLKNFVGLTGIISVSDYGSRTPIAAGEVGTIAGRPIIQTDAFSADLNASGVYDNTTKTKTSAAIFNRTNFRRPQLIGQSLQLDRQDDLTIDASYVRAKNYTGLTNMTKSSDAPVRLLFNMS